MCRELSAIVMRPIGDSPMRVIRNPDTSHHEDLLAMAGMKEDSLDLFVRTELVATDGDWSNPKLVVDEHQTPSWFDEIREAVEAEHLKYAASITITEDRPTLIGGTWIVLGKVVIQRASRCKLLVSKKADLHIVANISDTILFDDVYGTVTTGAVYGTVTTGAVSGTVTTGNVSGTVTTGAVSGTVTTGDVYVTVTTGDVYGTGSVKTGAVYGTGSVKKA